MDKSQQDRRVELISLRAKPSDRRVRYNLRSDEEKRASLRRMVGLAEQMREALLRNDLGGFGEVLHAGWMEKRKLAGGVTKPCIDEWYERARAHGAIGEKILGAGGVGFLLLYAPPERYPEIREALVEPSEFYTALR